MFLRLIQYTYLDRNGVGENSKLFLEFALLCFLIPPLCCHPCYFLREEAIAMFVNQYCIYYKSVEG